MVHGLGSSAGIDRKSVDWMELGLLEMTEAAEPDRESVDCMELEVACERWLEICVGQILVTDRLG